VLHGGTALSDKVTHFPRVKRETPDEIEDLPIMHQCLSEPEIVSFKWGLHLCHDGLKVVCLECGLGLSMNDLLDSVNEEEE